MKKVFASDFDGTLYFYKAELYIVYYSCTCLYGSDVGCAELLAAKD